MSTLYELTEDYKQLLDMMEDPDISEEAILNTLEFVDEEIEDKLDGYGRVIRTIEFNAENKKKEAERLLERAKSEKNRAESLKKRIEGAMLAMDKPKVKTLLFSYNIQNNAPSLDIETEQFIPEDYYIKQEPKLDRRCLLDAIKKGIEIQGVSIKQTASLRMR